MKVIFDHNMPVQVRRFLMGHYVMTAREMGWDRLRNGDLIRAGEAAGFDVMLTGDQKLFGEQSHLERLIALVVLDRSDWPGLQEQATVIREAIERAEPGGYELVKLPPRRKAGQ